MHHQRQGRGKHTDTKLPVDRARSRSRSRSRPAKAKAVHQDSRNINRSRKADTPKKDNEHDLSWSFPPLVHVSSSSVPAYAVYPFVETGYRVSFNTTQCLYSIFTFHNETMNIWTHLLALVALIGIVVVLTVDYLALPEKEKSKSSDETIDFAMIVLYAFCAGCTFLFSVIYHTFGCLNQSVHDCLLKVDLSGITLLLFGSYFPMFYYGFYCEKGWQQFYMFLCPLVVIVGSVVSWFGGGASQREFWTRVLGFSFLTAVGIIPSMHWVLYAPPEFLNPILPGVVGMFSVYGLGLFFYISKLPDRYIPWISEYTSITSHTLWHLGVIGGVTIWWYTIVTAQRLHRIHHANGCPNP